MLAELNKRGFRICEEMPVPYPTYLQGDGATEWRPVDDKRALRVLAVLVILEEQP